MNLFEYQGKRMFKEAGIPVPEGKLVCSAEELEDHDGGGVVKAQVLTGGRGKAGAIRVCNDSRQLRAAAEEILNMTVKGHRVKKILVEASCAIEKEYYFSIFIDRKKKCFSMMFTDQGGMEIEALPPSQIMTVDINPLIGLRPYMLKRLLFPFGLDKDSELKELLTRAYELFSAKQMQLLEINPLARDEGGRLIALDAKITLDDWNVDEALRTDDMKAGDLTEFERQMAEYDVTAVEMKGDIVVIGAGAGVSMATADSIVRKGGSVRAVIDLGTLPSDSADEEKSDYAAGAYRLLLTLKPKAILINEYMQAGRLDYEARTIKKALSEASKETPIIFRSKGRMAEGAIEILSGTAIYITDSYQEAIDKALSVTKEGR